MKIDLRYFIQIVLIVFLMGLLIGLVNSNHINTTVKFNSLGLESYSIEKCSVGGSCEYYESNTIIMLEFNRDHIIKIVPKRHFQGISGDTIYKYLNTTFIFSIGALIGLIFLVFWLIKFLTDKK